MRSRERDQLEDYELEDALSTFQGNDICFSDCQPQAQCDDGLSDEDIMDAVSMIVESMCQLEHKVKIRPEDLPTMRLKAAIDGNAQMEAIAEIAQSMLRGDKSSLQQKESTEDGMAKEEEAERSIFD